MDNQGTIAVVSGGFDFTVRSDPGGSWINHGLIEMTNGGQGGVLDLSGNWTNQGTITVRDSKATVSASNSGNGTWTNNGVIQVLDGGTLGSQLSGSINGDGALESSSDVERQVDASAFNGALFGGNLLGNITNSQLFDLAGTTTFGRAAERHASAPQLLEAMGRDLAPSRPGSTRTSPMARW